MRDPFDYPLEPMAPQQIQAEQKDRQARSSWVVTAVVIFLAACGLFLLMMNWMGKESQKTLGGDPGVIQDGVYYLYGNGGLTLPGQVNVPIGICAYTPGQEPEVLVSSQDYSLDPLFPCWGMNAHGLFFFDGNTNALYRMDLTSRAVTQLYHLPEAEDPEHPAFLFSLYMAGDDVILLFSNGQDGWYVTLDSQTGEVLARQDDQPQALKKPQKGTADYEIQRLGLPVGNAGEFWYAYPAFSDPWLFFVKEWPNENPDIQTYHAQLWAMNVETQESYLVSEDVTPYQAVTDGNWFYTCGGDTDCYQLEYNDQGIPCGLNLIEARI